MVLNTICNATCAREELNKLELYVSNNMCIIWRACTVNVWFWPNGWNIRLMKGLFPKRLKLTKLSTFLWTIFTSKVYTKCYTASLFICLSFTAISLSVGLLFALESCGKERAWETGNQEYVKNIIASFFKSGFPLLIRESSVRKVGICRLFLWAHSSSSTHVAYSEYLILFLLFLRLLG